MREEWERRREGWREEGSEGGVEEREGGMGGMEGREGGGEESLEGERGEGSNMFKIPAM